MGASPEEIRVPMVAVPTYSFECFYEDMPKSHIGRFWRYNLNPLRIFLGYFRRVFKWFPK